MSEPKDGMRAERVDHVLQRREAGVLDLADFGQVLGHDPQLALEIRVPGEHDLPACHACHFAESGEKIRPVVHCHDSHRDVEGAGPEGQRLGGPAHPPNSWMLVQHDLRGFDCHHLAIGRLVGTRARPDVQDRPGVGECRGDERCESGIGPPHVCVPEADPVIDGRHDAALASPVGWATTTKSVTEAKKGRVAR